MNVEMLQFVINRCVVKGCEKASSLRRTRRLVEKELLNYYNNNWNVYFATFTFNDNYLPFNRTKFVNYLRNTCKIHALLYSDYGKDNNRFHLHGFIMTKKELDIKNKDYFNKFGFTHFEYGNLKGVEYMIKYSVKFNSPTFRLINVKPQISV